MRCWTSVAIRRDLAYSRAVEASRPRAGEERHRINIGLLCDGKSQRKGRKDVEGARRRWEKYEREGGLTRIVMTTDLASRRHQLGNRDTLSFSTRDTSYDIVTN